MITMMITKDYDKGDPRNVLCDAVEKHHASMLVVGSHSYGALKRYRLILILVIIFLLLSNDIGHIGEYDNFFSKICERG